MYVHEFGFSTVCICTTVGSIKYITIFALPCHRADAHKVTDKTLNIFILFCVLFSFYLQIEYFSWYEKRSKKTFKKLNIDKNTVLTVLYWCIFLVKKHFLYSKYLHTRHFYSLLLYFFSHYTPYWYVNLTYTILYSSFL